MGGVKRPLVTVFTVKMVIISEVFAVNLGHIVIGRCLVLVREAPPPLGVETGHVTAVVRSLIHAPTSRDVSAALPTSDEYDATGSALDPRTESIPRGLYFNVVVSL